MHAACVRFHASLVTPHPTMHPVRAGRERAHPGLVISPPGRPNRVAWGIGNCLLHYIFSANASFSSLFSHCGLSLSTNVAFTALHAQHVAFLAHLERISPFPGPAQAQGYIDMPCYGGGFSFFFFLFISCWTTKPVWIQLSLVTDRIRQLLFM